MNSVQSIERAASLLRAIAQSGRGGARLSELARTATLSKSTAHRLLGALKQVGLVEQSAESGLFHLGVEAFALGAVAANRHRLADIAQPSLLRLVERTGDTVYLTVRVGLDGLCVERREGTFPIKALTLEVGDRLPLGIGAGNLAMLAGLSDEEVALALVRTAPQIARYPNLDIARVRGVVEAARRHGHTIVETLFIPGMSAVGVAIAGRDSVPIAGLSVAAISSRMRAQRRANVVAWLKSEARAIEAALNQAGSDAGLRRAASQRGRGR